MLIHTQKQQAADNQKVRKVLSWSGTYFGGVSPKNPLCVRWQQQMFVVKDMRRSWTSPEAVVMRLWRSNSNCCWRLSSFSGPSVATAVGRIAYDYRYTCYQMLYFAFLREAVIYYSHFSDSEDCYILVVLLWLPYGIGHAIIFLPCGFFLSSFLFLA